MSTSKVMVLPVKVLMKICMCFRVSEFELMLVVLAPYYFGIFPWNSKIRKILSSGAVCSLNQR